MRAGDERGFGYDATTKIVAAGLLGLQFIGIPIVALAKGQVASAAVPRLEVDTTASQRSGILGPRKAVALSSEDEMIGEWSTTTALVQRRWVWYRMDDGSYTCVCNCFGNKQRFTYSGFWYSATEGYQHGENTMIASSTVLALPRYTHVVQPHRWTPFLSTASPMAASR